MYLADFVICHLLSTGEQASTAPTMLTIDFPMAIVRLRVRPEGPRRRAVAGLPRTGVRIDSPPRIERGNAPT
jgi:hypothetical protein